MTTVSKAAPSVTALPASSPPNSVNARLLNNSINARASSPAGLSFAGLEARTFDKTHTLRLSMRSDTSAPSRDTSLSLKTDYRGPIIPPYQDKNFRRRTLVLCFDGTGDQFDMDNSNVVQFFSVLKKGDRKRQLVYYQSGIGTYSIPQVASPLHSKISMTLDLMFANHLNHHVMSGYRFLMQNYKEGDKICIFGFSRGAYTARALAGMIHKVGLLPAGNEQQVPFAYKMYKSDTEQGWKQSVAFKKTFSMDVDIDFVGVWDTVASVGLLPTTLPFTKSNTAIKVFRHALSLDEHRVKFKPSIYQRITDEEARRGDFTPPPTTTTSRHTSPTVLRGRKQEKTKEVVEVRDVERTDTRTGTGIGDGASGKSKLKTTTTTTTATTETTATATVARRSATGPRSSESGSRSRSRAVLSSLKRSARGVSDSLQEVVERVSLDREKSKDRSNRSREDDKDAYDLSPDSERDQLEQMYLDRSRPTDVLEVWFAGCHCDVGGGSVPNNTPNSLARIPLRWMIRECFLARTGIQFEAERLRDLGMDPATLYPRVMKPPHPESLDSPIQSDVPEPLPFLPAPPMTNDTTQAVDDHGMETVKQEAVSTGAQVMQRAGTEAMTEEGVTVTASFSAPSPSHERQNNISLDATLVNYDSDSVDAPDVHIEGASMMDEKLSPTSEDLHCMPVLGGDSSTATSVRPSPGPGQVHPVARDTNFKAFEAQADVRDARSGVYDQLKLAKWWWILEFVPMRERVQLADGTWKKKWSLNRGRPRTAPQEEPLMVHSSVRMRMQAKDVKYTPRLKFAREPIWID